MAQDMMAHGLTPKDAVVVNLVAVVTTQAVNVKSVLVLSLKELTLLEI
jgi:hypothetical protein